MNKIEKEEFKNLKENFENINIAGRKTMSAYLNLKEKYLKLEKENAKLMNRIQINNNEYLELLKKYKELKG